MTNQPYSPSNAQKSGAQQSGQQFGDTHRTGQQQVGGSAGMREGDSEKPGGQTQTAPQTRNAPAKQPGDMPNPI
jgi:hypothetical protein